MSWRRPWGMGLAICLSGCAAQLIPGTDIEKTPETTAIIDLMTKYNAAIDSGDAAGILALVDTSYYDDSGTLNPEDDLDYNGLKAKLTALLQKFQDVRVTIRVKTLTVDGNSAAAVYNYVLTFRIGQKTQTETDIKRMDFKRVNGVWKITKGL